MAEFPCSGLFVRNTNMALSIIDQLDRSQQNLIERVASDNNMTVLDLFREAFRIVPAASIHRSNDNQTLAINCVQGLLTLLHGRNLSSPTESPKTQLDPYMDNRDQHNPYIILSLICCIMILIVAILGVIGNAVSVWFFGRLSAKSSINTLLTAMAAFDCILLLTGAPLYFLVGIHSYTGREYFLRPLQCCLIYFYTISVMSQTATTWMLVLITFERYIAVCRPFLQRRVCTLGRARKAVLGVSAFAIGYNVVRFWEYESDPDSSQPKHLLRDDPLYKSVYMHWMYLTIVFLIPFTIIAFFNALIIRTIRAARITRRSCRVHAGARNSSMSQSANRIPTEHRTAGMLLVVVLVFMLCEVLAPILNALEMIDKNIKDRPMFAFLSDLNNLLVLLHSTMNVGIYVGFCSEFRRVCRLLVPFVRRVFCCSKKPLSPDVESDFSAITMRGSQRRRIGSFSSGNGLMNLRNSAERLPLTKTESNRFNLTVISRTGSVKFSDSSCV